MVAKRFKEDFEGLATSHSALSIHYDLWICIEFNSQGPSSSATMARRVIEGNVMMNTREDCIIVSLQIFRSSANSVLNVTADGRVHIASIAKFLANTAAATCTAANSGGIYYDGFATKHHGWNGTGWNALY
jgi:hypothetical protein